jgi:hypothetical protein
MTAAMGRLELIGRCYAEGMKEAFKLIHKLNCKYQDQPRVVRLTGKKFAPVDPSSWNADMDMSVSVGLGTGDRDAQMMAANMIGVLQEKLLALGMVKPEQIMATCEMVVNAAGQKGVERFFSLPDPNAPPKPDPDMAKVQQEGQIKTQQLQQDGQIKGAQIQQDGAIKQKQSEVDAALALQKQQGEIGLKKYQTDQELILKRQQLEAELQLKREQMAAELELKREQGEMAMAQQSADIGRVDVGGEPG